MRTSEIVAVSPAARRWPETAPNAPVAVRPPCVRIRYSGRCVGLHTGKIVQGAIVLDDADSLEEGASVTVWVERSQEPVALTEPELELVRKGQAEAARGQGVDARRALEALRGE